MAEIALGGIRPCAKCGMSKPWNIDYFRPAINSGRCSLRHRCRICEGYRDEGNGRLTRRGRLTDTEREVARQLYNQNFFDKDPDHARSVWRASAQRNREQRKKAAKQRWANRDPEQTKQKYAIWKSANRERIRDYMRAYGPGWTEANRDKCRMAVKRWRDANPQKARHSTQAYWARRHGAIGSHTFSEKQALFAEQKGLCFYCCVKLQDGFHADHFIPLAKGGSDYIANIRLACPTCNCRKSDKMPWEWMPHRFAAP